MHVGALARSDFPAETLAALARDRRLSFDGQGLVRPARTGPLALDAEYDPEVLRHVSILKLAEEEARVLVGEPDADALRSLGVPEIVVTFGSEGSLVFAEGRLERVPARPVGGEVDPTGAGDAFIAAYLVSRSSGYAPVPAARRATRARGGPARPAAGMRALVRTVDGVFEVDLEEDVVLGPSSEEVEPQEVPLSLPLVVAAAASGSTVIAVVDRRPPLAVSNDAGRTWREAGGGLPPGRAIAIAEDDPDHVALRRPQPALRVEERRRLLAGAHAGAPGDRGGRAQGSLNSPRATITALPPTSTRSSCSAVPSARANSVDGRPISTPCVISISSPKPMRPCRARCTASGPAAEPVAGSSATPPPGANMRARHCVPSPAKQ